MSTLLASDAGIGSQVEQVIDELKILVFSCVVEGSIALVVFGVDLFWGEFCVQGFEGCV